MKGIGGLPKDEKLAVEWYRKAGEKGNAQVKQLLKIFGY